MAPGLRRWWHRRAYEADGTPPFSFSLRCPPLGRDRALQHIEPVDDHVRNWRLLREYLENEESSVASDVKLFQLVAAGVGHIDENLRTRSFEGPTSGHFEDVHVRAIRAQAAVKQFRAVARPSRRAAATSGYLPARAGDIRYGLT